MYDDGPHVLTWHTYSRHVTLKGHQALDYGCCRWSVVPRGRPRLVNERGQQFSEENMKTLRTILIALALCIPAFAWNCPTGQIRQQAPAGTSTSTPFYDVIEGIAFICVPVNPVTPTGVNNSNTNSNSSTSTSTSTSSSNSSASSTQRQRQQQNQSQVANGGNATSSSSANGNGNNSNDSISNTNIAAPQIPVSSAITPPIMPTVPCFKGFGGSAQTMAFGASFGGGKIDKGCNARELARSFSGPQTIASCKILLATKEAVTAGITMADCLPVAPVAMISPIAVEPTPVAPALPAITVNLVLPSNQAVTSAPSNRMVTPAITKKAVRRKMHMQPQCQNDMELRCVVRAK
jgi:hypothetical protein